METVGFEPTFLRMLQQQCLTGFNACFMIIEYGFDYGCIKNLRRQGNLMNTYVHCTHY